MCLENYLKNITFTTTFLETFLWWWNCLSLNNINVTYSYIKKRFLWFCNNKTKATTKLLKLGDFVVVQSVTLVKNSRVEYSVDMEHCYFRSIGRGCRKHPRLNQFYHISRDLSLCIYVDVKLPCSLRFGSWNLT